VTLGITPGKLNLIQRLQALDPAINVEDYKSSSVKDIQKKAKELRKENKNNEADTDNNTNTNTNTDTNIDKDVATEQSTNNSSNGNGNVKKEENSSINNKKEDNHNENGKDKDIIKPVKRTVAAWLGLGNPIDINGNTIIILFDEQNSFGKKNLENPAENRKIVEESFSRVLKKHARVKFMLPEKEKSVESIKGIDEDIQRVRDVLGDNIVEVID
jgi:hypothetical protein